MPSGDDLGICATWDDLSNLENWNLGQKPNPSFFDACGRSRDVVYGILIVRTLRVFFLLKKTMAFRHIPALGGLEPLGGSGTQNPKIQKSKIQKFRFRNSQNPKSKNPGSKNPGSKSPGSKNPKIPKSNEEPGNRDPGSQVP